MAATILITGGAGYIGSHTAYLLAQLGYHVLILDTFVHNQYFNPTWATVIKGNIANQSLLSGIFSEYNISAVMHFAANIEVGQSVKHPLLFYQNNVSNTVTLLQTMLAHKVKKIIFSSSCAVYGIPKQLPLTENHAIDPLSPYGKTKAAVESILSDCAYAYDLKFVSLRYFNAAGCLPEENLGEQHEPETHVIPLLIRAAMEDKPFHLFGTDFQTHDGSAVRDYVHVLDIASAHIAALEYLEAGNQSDYFNLGTGTGYSVIEMIQATQDIIGKKITIIKTARRAGDPHTLVANAHKAEQILGWKSSHSDLKLMIQSAYEFYLKQMELRSNFRYKEKLLGMNG